MSPDPINGFDPTEATISDVHTALQTGDLTEPALIEWHLTQIQRLDDDLNALLTVNQAATDTAHELAETRRDAGLTGPLHGIPIILKDNVCTTDLPTTGGSPVFAEWHPDHDAHITTNLREAGGIIIGKANLHELARGGTTVSALGGQTKNPYAPSRTPGGSSGGTGAAIAANYGLLGIGSDTVNSIRSPASACNLVGIRPSTGLVSRSGIMPVALTQDTAGPITRTVEDAARMLSVLAGYDPTDRATATAHDTPTDYAAILDDLRLEAVSLGVVESLFGNDPVHKPINTIIEGELDRMAAAGAEITRLEADLDIDALIERVDVQQWEAQTQFNDFLEAFEEPPVESYQEVVETGEYDESIEEHLLSAYGVDEPVDYQQYLRSLREASVLRETLYDLFARHGLDALVFPHQKRPVVPIGEDQDDRNGFLASGSGFVGITVPAGFTDEGVPVGIEFVGKPFTEQKLLEIAYAYEQLGSHRTFPEQLEQD